MYLPNSLSPVTVIVLAMVDQRISILIHHNVESE